MNQMTTPATRRYHSELRTAQAGRTRERILDAAVQLMASGVAHVTIPDVAREAGVPVPTIYSHFRAKRDLFGAVYPHLVRRAGLDDAPLPRSVDEFREWVYGLFDRIDALGPVARAAIAGPAADQVRRLTMPDRLAASRRFAEAVGPVLSEVEQERLARILVILTSSSAQRLWRDHLGSSVAEAADDLDWMLRVVIAGATQGTER